MSMELLQLGVGVTLAGLILNGQRYQREEIKSVAGFKALREEINNLREINNLNAWHKEKAYHGPARG